MASAHKGIENWPSGQWTKVTSVRLRRDGYDKPRQMPISSFGKLAYVVKRLEAAFRSLDDKTRLYQILFKHNLPAMVHNDSLAHVLAWLLVGREWRFRLSFLRD